jgi:prepilin-type N-terminal cleavage/methylation domain-containing protein
VKVARFAGQPALAATGVPAPAAPGSLVAAVPNANISLAALVRAAGAGDQQFAITATGTAQGLDGIAFSVNHSTPKRPWSPPARPCQQGLPDNATADRCLRNAETLITVSSAGFTILELMIGLTVLGIVLMIRLPSLATFIQNTQIRPPPRHAIRLQLARARRCAATPPFGSSSWTICATCVLWWHQLGGEPCNRPAPAAGALVTARRRSSEGHAEGPRTRLTATGGSA